MAITKKPKPKVEPSTESVDVEALIRKGGSVAGDGNTEQADKIASLILRIPTDVLIRINEAVKSRRIKIPRHTWLIEAVMEKLDRESSN